MLGWGRGSCASTAFLALAKDLSLLSTIHSGQPKAICNCSSLGSVALFWPLWAPTYMWTYYTLHKNAHINKNEPKIFLRFNHGSHQRKEKQAKLAWKFHLHLHAVTVSVNRKAATNAPGDLKQRKHLHIAGGNVNESSHCGNLDGAFSQI